MNATVGLATLVNGEIDYYTSLAAGVAAAIRGVPVKIVACYVPGPTATLIARPEFKSIQELRGKTIGIDVFGSNLNIIARNIFTHSGLDPDKEVKFLAAGPLEARLASMKQGLIVPLWAVRQLIFLARRWALLFLRGPTNFSVFL